MDTRPGDNLEPSVSPVTAASAPTAPPSPPAAPFEPPSPGAGPAGARSGPPVASSTGAGSEAGAGPLDLGSLPPPVLPSEPVPSGPPALTRIPSSVEAAPPVVVPGEPRVIGAPPPAAPPVVVDNPEPDPEPLIVTQPGWGWRALASFMAGGALVAAGFVVGSRSAELEAVETAPTTTAPLNTVPSSTAPAPSAASGAEDRDPAVVVAEQLGPSVVQIEIGDGVGSGVIYRDGLILTNEHVVRGATQVAVILRDGRILNGEVVGVEPDVDVAVITVGEGLGLPVAPLALDETPAVGSTAIAIGSPFRLQQTVTEGIVSAVNRPIPAGQVYTPMIQTDAPINPGNSGGALANGEGRVIGINTAIQTRSFDNVNSGVGFAIPIDTAVSVADRLAEGEPILRGFLGVEGGPAVDGSAGVEIRSITPDSAAEEAGIEVGDRVLSVDGAPVTQIQELAGLVASREPGDVVALEVVRGEEQITVQVPLGQRN